MYPCGKVFDRMRRAQLSPPPPPSVLHIMSCGGGVGGVGGRVIRIVICLSQGRIVGLKWARKGAGEHPPPPQRSGGS